MNKIFLITALLLQQVAFGQKMFHGSLQSGDILFQDLDCGPLCEAIEAVTESYAGRHFSHIGLVSVEEDSVFVIEAIGSKVKRTQLVDFVARNQNEILLGRLKRKSQQLGTAAVGFAQAQIGVPYDEVFLYDNGKYYCSELLYDAFKAANQGIPFFSLEPMTFKDPNTQAYFPAWVDYYEQIATAIPEHQLGINPGGISRSPKLRCYVYRK